MIAPDSIILGTMETTPISKYTLAEADSDADLIIAVNKLIALGWVPIGGVTIAGKLFLQAMVRPSLEARA
jgi:hypothetical protein